MVVMPRRSVISERPDQLGLALLRIAGQAELLRTLTQFVDCPVLIVACLPAAAADLGASLLGSAGRVRYASRLLLRRSVISKLFIQLGVLEPRVRVARHECSPFLVVVQLSFAGCAASCRTSCARARSRCTAAATV